MYINLESIKKKFSGDFNRSRKREKKVEHVNRLFFLEEWKKEEKDRVFSFSLVLILTKDTYHFQYSSFCI